MRKIWAIAARDYRASVKTKAFLVTLFLMPVLMVGSFAAQMVVSKLDSTKKRRVVVVDRTKGGELAKFLEAIKFQTHAGTPMLDFNFCIQPGMGIPAIAGLQDKSLQIHRIALQGVRLPVKMVVIHGPVTLERKRVPT